MSKDRFFGKGLSWFLPGFLLLLQLALPAAVSVPVVIAADAGATGVEKEGYELIWQDEFDGVAIDPANWTFDLGAGGWGNVLYRPFGERGGSGRDAGYQRASGEVRRFIFHVGAA